MAVAGIALAALLSGCGAQPGVVAGTSVTVAVGSRFSSANPDTSYGGTRLNADIAALTGSGFGHYDADREFVEDADFGRAEIVSQEPFTVRYTLADATVWSDGTPVDAADLLLDWAANSRALNDPDFEGAEFIDGRTGQFTEDFPDDVVYFDGGDDELTVDSSATVDASGRGITVRFSQYTPDWQLAVQPTVPAHVLGAIALGVEDAQPAKRAVISAIADDDREALAVLSRTWNSGWNFREQPDDPRLLISSGPYRIDAIDESGLVTLVANPQYRGARQPGFERVEVRPVRRGESVVQLLQSGQIDVVAPQPSAQLVTALRRLVDVEVTTGSQNVVEQFVFKITDSRNGSVADPVVRRAFLRVLPRADIVEQLIAPIDPETRLLESLVFHPQADGYVNATRTNGSVVYSEVDFERAETLLDEAADRVHRVCILYDPDDPRRVAQFELIRSTANQAGFRVTSCASRDWQALLGKPDAYDAALVDTTLSGDGVAPVVSQYRSGSSANQSGYAKPEMDALIDGVLAADGDPERQRELLTEIDGLLWQDAVGAPMFSPPSLVAVGPQVSGVALSPLQRSVLSDAWRWRPTSTGTPTPTVPPANG